MTVKVVKLTFPRQLRLLTPNHFTFVFQQPYCASTSYMTIIGRVNMLTHPRIGITVSKKYVKLAHDRNRIKRLTRESFRLHQYVLPNMDFVVIAKKGISYMDNNVMTEALEKLWRRYYC